MILTPRLQAVANFVPQGSKVGDVGSDHGYLPVYLVENNKVETVIASDINQGPVDNAIEAVTEAGLVDQIEVRLGGGLTPYTMGEIDTATICGMGGLLIKNILLESDTLAKSLKKIILQPMVSQSDLRTWLVTYGYEILEETIVREGSKYYEIFSVKYGKPSDITELQKEIGFSMVNPNNPDSLAWLDYKINKFKLIEKKIRHNGSENAAAMLEKSIEMKSELEALKTNVCKL